MANDRSSLVSLRKLSKSYFDHGEQRVVLNNVSLEVSRGDFLAILGSSGSGKTTLLHLIGGIDTPDSGSITLDGNELTSLGDTERTCFRRRHVGMVFQFFNLIPTLTVWENVLLPAELEGTVDARLRDHAAALLKRVGLSDRKHSFPDRLSGGEQQRVAIVRALAHEPLIVLADEPTGNLDAENSTLVLSLLLQLTREAGRTLLMATHDHEIVRQASRICRLHGGALTPHPASASLIGAP
jgi:putative ABC transport system ATP-binding protein